MYVFNVLQKKTVLDCAISNSLNILNWKFGTCNYDSYQALLLDTNDIHPHALNLRSLAIICELLSVVQVQESSCVTLFKKQLQNSSLGG